MGRPRYGKGERLCDGVEKVVPLENIREKIQALLELADDRQLNIIYQFVKSITEKGRV